MPIDKLPSDQRAVMERALFREGAAAGVTPVNERAAVAVNKALDEGGVLEAAKIGARLPVDRDKAKRQAETIGGYKRDANGNIDRPAGSPAERRYKNANVAIDLNADYLEKGFDGMTAGQKTILLSKVISSSMFSPLLAKEFGRTGVTDAQKKDFARRMLKDPRYAAHVRSIFDSLGEQTIIEDNDAVIRAKEVELETEKLNKGQKTEAKGRTARELQQIEDQLTRMRSGRVSRTSTSSEQHAALLRSDIRDLDTQIKQNRLNIATYRQTVTRFEEELQAALNPPAAPVAGAAPVAPRSTRDINEDLRRARDQHDRAVNAQRSLQEDRVNRSQELESMQEKVDDKESTLETKKKNAEEAKAQAEKDERIADLRIESLERDLKDMVSKREQQEETLFKKYFGVANEAAVTWVDEEIDHINTQLTTEIEDLKTRMKDTHQEALRKALSSELMTVGTKGRSKNRPVIRKDKAREYVNDLIANGPKGTMRKFILTQTNPQTGSAYTEVEANSILADQGYFDEMKPQVIKTVLARHMLANGIDMRIIDAVENSSWGKGMIDQALEHNQTFKETILRVQGAGVLDRDHLFYRTIDMIKRHPILLLLLLLGGVAAGAVGAAVFAPAVGAGLGAAGGAAGAAALEGIGVTSAARGLHPASELA